MLKLDEYREFVIPFIGEANVNIRVKLQVHAVVNALRDDFSDQLRGFSRRLVAGAIFLNWSNHRLFPPNIQEALKRRSRERIRKEIPALVEKINWDGIGLASPTLTDENEFAQLLKRPA